MNPSPTEFKSSQYEFNDEQNKEFSGLAAAMGTVSTLMKLLGLSFVIFFGMLIYHAAQTNSGYGPAAGVGAAMLLFLAIGFWTGSAAHSFRRIVETKNEDIWHLMNAVGSLKNMYGMLRGIIMLSLVLVIVGVTLLAVTWARTQG
jgi:hypothetical protein